MSKNKENIDPMYVLFRPATKEFVNKAAEKAGTSGSEFGRDLIIKGAEKVMGKAAPAVEAFSKGGHPGLFSVEAAKLGLTVAQLKNKLATEALGGMCTPPAGKAKKAKKG